MRFSILLFLVSIALGAAQAGAQELRLVISTDSAAITSPYPLRLTLHFLNAGKKTLWLYQPVRTAAAHQVYEPDVQQGGSRRTVGGSELKVSLTPAGSASPASDGKADLFLPMELPHPKLVRIPPGGDAEEPVQIHLEPAMKASGNQKFPIWGDYRLSVTYSARYSNVNEIEHLLGVDLWHAEASSNTLRISLQQGNGEGSVAGQVTSSTGESEWGMQVTLSNRDEVKVGQLKTDRDGNFSFDGLPWGLYWVTVRRPAAGAVTAVYEHTVLSASSPAATVNLMLLPVETYFPKQFLHKPVLIRVTDGPGHPAANVKLNSTFSNGPIVESVKAETGADGLAQIEVIPGYNFLSLKKHGCQGEDRRMDVVPGGGVQGFQFEISCGKK